MMMMLLLLLLLPSSLGVLFALGTATEALLSFILTPYTLVLVIYASSLQRNR